MYGSLERVGAGRPEFMESGEQSGMYAVPGTRKFPAHTGAIWSAGGCKAPGVTGISEAEGACPSVEIVILSN